MSLLVRIVGGCLVLVLVGVVYQLAGMALDQRQHPPPGQLIDIGRPKLHLYCTGKGSPTVILEAMGVGWSTYWNKVQPEIAKITRVCSYDRAGFGWSESGPLPRTGQRMADELHQLLTRGGISGPYVLVGHSLGGFIVRLYRQAHPNDVVGMVLVEAGHERQFEQEEFKKFVASGEIVFPMLRTMTAVGLTRLLTTFDLVPPLIAEQEKTVSMETRARLRIGWLQTRYFATMADEGAALAETTEQVRHARLLGNLPLIVLTATGPMWWPDMPSDIDQRKFRQMWLKLQTDLTRLSTNHRQLFADHGSHFMNFDQPDLIIDAVRQMVKNTGQKPLGQ